MSTNFTYYQRFIFSGINYFKAVFCLCLFSIFIPVHGQYIRQNQDIAVGNNNMRILATTDFKGVNRADIFDNFKDDQLVIGGLSLTDDYSTFQSKSRVI